MTQAYPFPPFSDAFYIPIEQFKDNRGSFTKYYSNQIKTKIGFAGSLHECFLSISHSNVFRGLHFQAAPRDCWKFVTVIKGSITDFLVDCRELSPTLRQIGHLHVDSQTPCIIAIPPGFAHGFLSKQDDTTLIYLTSQPYDAKYDSGINYQFVQHLLPQNLVISDRDKCLPPYLPDSKPLFYYNSVEASHSCDLDKIVILTGSTGFLGRHFLKLLIYSLPTSTNFLLIVRDKTSALSKLSKTLPLSSHSNVKLVTLDELSSYISSLSPLPVWCAHLACSSHFSNTKAAISDLIESIVEIPTHLLSLFSTLKCPVNFVTVGSMWQEYNTDQPNSFNLYAALKSSFDEVLRYYIEAYENISGLTLMIPDTFGEYDTRPKLINLIFNALGNNNVLSISGGEQYMDFLHIDDVAQALYYSLLSLPHADWRRHGISSGNPIKLIDIAEYINTRAGKIIEIGAKPYRSREVFHSWSNINPLPGWHPSSKSNIYSFIDSRLGS